MSPEVAVGSCEAKPPLPEAKMYGKSSCSSLAPSSTKVSKTSLSTSFGPGVGPVDLVDHDDRPDVAGERLAEHELGLRHRPFEGVDQHQGAVGHLEGPLDLAAEIGVARRVDDVDLGRAVVDGDVLGQDRDPALAFLVVGVENALALKLGGPELAGLAEHHVDQRGLAMVDVGDDGHVADVVASDHEFSIRPPMEPSHTCKPARTNRFSQDQFYTSLGQNGKIGIDGCTLRGD